MSEKRKVLRAAGLVGAITLLSRFTGLIRDALMAAIFGRTRHLDVFLTAFELSNLTRRVLGEGALSSFIVPVMSERIHHGGREAGWRFFNIAANFMLVVSLVLTVLGCFFSREVFMIFGGLGLLKSGAPAEFIELGTRLTRIMFPFVIGLTVGSVMMGACHTLRSFGPPSMGSVMLNVSMILAGGALLAFGIPAKTSPAFPAAMQRATFWLAWSVLAGAALRVAVMVPSLRRAGWRWQPDFSWRDPALRSLLRMMVPGLLAVGISQINISVAGLFAMYLGEGVKTSINMASRLIQFPMALTASAAATAMLPQLSMFLLHDKRDELRELMALTKRIEIVVMVPAAMGLIILGLPIIEMIYQHGQWTAADSRDTYIALLCYAPGLLPLGWVRLLEPLFFARHDRVTPLKAASISMAVNVALNWLLAFHTPLHRLGYGQAALAIANTIASYVNYAALAWWMGRVLERPMGDRPRIWETFGKALLAAGFGCGAGAGVYWALAGWVVTPHNTLTRAACLGPAIALAAAVHFALVHVLRVPDSENAMAMLRGKLKKS